MGQEIGRTSFDASDFDRFASRLRQETGRLLAWAQAGGIRDVSGPGRLRGILVNK